MAEGVYVLTALGRRACAGDGVTVPAQLRQLLHAINGSRTRKEVLVICGRSAVNAGGFSWLASAGYIERLAAPYMPPSTLAANLTIGAAPFDLGASGAPMSVARGAAPPAKRSTASGVLRAEERRGASIDPGPSTLSSRAGPPTDVSVLPMQSALSAYMQDTIRRHLGERREGYLRRVEAVTSMSDLLAHLNPLMDAVLDAAGPQAAAEFADGAAAILQPRGR